MIKKRLGTLVENVAESGTSCMVTMLQGNLLAMGLSHWVIASQTGVVAGAASVAALSLTRTENRFAIAAVLGVVTAVVDYFVHPGMIGHAEWTEAALTGLGAALLSLIAGTLIDRYRQRRKKPAH